MLYAIRLTFPYEKLKDFFDRFEKAVVYQHDADESVSRTHVHALLEMSVSTDTAKNWVTKSVGYRPKSDMWSFVSKLQKQPVTMEYITYMTKGKLEPVMLKGYDKELCDKYKARWVNHIVPDRQITTNKVVTNYDIAVELKQWITTEIWDGSEYEQHRKLGTIDDINHRFVVNKCVELHNKYRKTYTQFSLLKVIETAWGLCPTGTKWRDRLVNAVVRKLDLSIEV